MTIFAEKWRDAIIYYYYFVLRSTETWQGCKIVFQPAAHGLPGEPGQFHLWPGIGQGS